MDSARFYINTLTPSHRGGPSPRNNGWLYLGYDYTKLHLSKIGVTTGPLFARINSSTVNPDYVILCAFNLNATLDDLKIIEGYVSNKTRSFNKPRPTGRKSEWWHIAPHDALSIIVEKLPNVFSFERDDGGEVDYTNIIYIPDVDPFATDLRGPRFERLVRLSSPHTYIDLLKSGYFNFNRSEEFIHEVMASGPQSPLCICAPQVLNDRINYDIACRKYFNGYSER